MPTHFRPCLGIAKRQIAEAFFGSHDNGSGNNTGEDVNPGKQIGSSQNPATTSFSLELDQRPVLVICPLLRLIQLKNRLAH